MMTHLSTFIPNFSQESQPLRELLKKDVPFVMSKDLIHCFNNLKKLVSSTIYLKFFDPKKPTVLEVNSSMKGLGAAVIQDGYPVAVASKSLDSTQSNDPNTDREMLAVIFGITRFHMYLYGRPFKVITDHKPLETIVQKPLLKAPHLLTPLPPRLQRMLQKIQGYDYVVEYRSGKSMTLADTLSRFPSRADKTSLDLDLCVDDLYLSKDEIGFCQYDFISFTSKKQYHLREATKTDPRAEQPDGDHSTWMAKQRQSTPRRRQTILVIQRRARSRRWNHLQRTGSHCTRGSPAGCAEATPSISPRPRKDATTGQRMRILAKHLQGH